MDKITNIDVGKLYEEIVKEVRKYEEATKDNKDAYDKIIPAKIKLYLSKEGMTKDALAKKLDVSRMQLFRWLTGESVPMKETIKKMEDMDIL